MKLDDQTIFIISLALCAAGAIIAAAVFGAPV